MAEAGVDDGGTGQAEGPARIGRRRFLKICAAALPAACVLDAFLVEPGWLAVRRIDLGVSDPTVRVVHLTDIHHKGDRGWLESVVSRINSLSPDVVCFTGDLIEESAHLSEALEVLGGLRAPLYGCPGNHEHWSGVDFDEIASAFGATGGGWLVDAEVPAAGGRVAIAGSDNHGTEFLVRSGEGSPPRRILLCHYPVFADEAAAAGLSFDVILAGHSHGGQVRLPLVGALMVPYNTAGYELGLYSTGAGPLYVGSGVGWYYLPVRFCCRPEVAVLEL